jgi:hypothetical protein
VGHHDPAQFLALLRLAVLGLAVGGELGDLAVKEAVEVWPPVFE